MSSVFEFLAYQERQESSPMEEVGACPACTALPVLVGSNPLSQLHSIRHTENCEYMEWEDAQ